MYVCRDGRPAGRSARTRLCLGMRLNIQVSKDVIAIEVKTPPAEALRVRFKQKHTLGGTDKAGFTFTLKKPGIYRFRRQK